MTLTNFQDNLEVTFDYESETQYVISSAPSPNSMIWMSSLTVFIEYLPLQYNQFVFADIGDLNYNLKLSFQGNLDKYLPLVYMHVLKECGLYVEESIEINKTLRVINLAKDILSPDSYANKKGENKIGENYIAYKNLPLGSVLKLISESNQDLNFIFAEGLSCKQRVNLTIKKNRGRDIKEIAQYLNSVGIYVELVKEHQVYTVKKVET